MNRKLVLAISKILFLCCTLGSSAGFGQTPPPPSQIDAEARVDGQQFNASIPGLNMDTFTGGISKVFNDFSLPLQNGKRYSIGRTYRSNGGWSSFVPVIPSFSTLVKYSVNPGKNYFNLQMPSGESVVFKRFNVGPNDAAASQEWGLARRQWVSLNVPEGRTSIGRSGTFLSVDGRWRATCGHYGSGRSTKYWHNVAYIDQSGQTAYAATNSLGYELFAGCLVDAPDGSTLSFEAPSNVYAARTFDNFAILAANGCGLGRTINGVFVYPCVLNGVRTNKTPAELGLSSYPPPAIDIAFADSRAVGAAVVPQFRSDLDIPAGRESAVYGLTKIAFADGQSVTFQYSELPSLTNTQSVWSVSALSAISTSAGGRAYFNYSADLSSLSVTVGGGQYRYEYSALGKGTTPLGQKYQMQLNKVTTSAVVCTAENPCLGGTSTAVGGAINEWVQYGYGGRGGGQDSVCAGYQAPDAALVSETDQSGNVRSYTYRSAGIGYRTLTIYGQTVLSPLCFDSLSQFSVTDTIGTNLTWNITRANTDWATRSGFTSATETDIRQPDGTLQKIYHYGYYNTPNDYRTNATPASIDSRLGLPYRVETYSAAGDLTRSKDYEWWQNAAAGDTGCIPGSGDVCNIVRSGFFLNAISKVTTTQDGSVYSTTYQNFDQYGNATLINSQGERTVSINREFVTDRTSWRIAQLRHQFGDGIDDVTIDYYPNGSLQAEHKNGVTTSTFYYNGDGSLNKSLDANGNPTSYSDYYFGIARHIDYPDGFFISRGVQEGTGLITSQTDEEGRTVQFAYDLRGRVSQTNYPGGNPETQNLVGNVLTQSRGGYRKDTLFDALGRVVRIRNSGAQAGSIEVQYQYDYAGRKTYISQPYFATALGSNCTADGCFVTWPLQSAPTGGDTLLYDTLGRLKKITHPDQSSAQYSYLTGNRVQVTDENQKNTIMNYWSYGDVDQKFLARIDTPDPAATVAIDRNAKGQPLSYTQSGLTRTYHYNGQFMMDWRTDPEIGTTNFTYDNTGNVKTRTLANSTTWMDYDGRNRLYHISHSDGTPETNIKYYGNGLIQNEQFGDVQRHYGYDANNNLQTEYQLVDKQLMYVRYEYDGNDKLMALNYPSGYRVAYTPDELGQIRSVSGLANNVSYYPSGALKEMTFANGLKANYQLDNRLRPSNSLLANSSGSALLNTTKHYDFVGNVKDISDTADPTLNRNFRYDDINRMTGADGYWGVGTIGYDGRDNIISQQYGAASTKFSYGIDASTNRMTSVSGAKSNAFAYDLNGNITYNGQHTFDYDGMNNLNCVDCASPNPIRLGYGPGQLRARKLQQGVTKYYLKSRSGLDLFELDPASKKASEYYYLGGTLLARRDYTFASFMDGDADGDGMSDKAEIRYKLDPFDKTDAARDDDGDGYTNAQEIAMGRNPHVNEEEMKKKAAKIVPGILQLLLED